MSRFLKNFEKKIKKIKKITKIEYFGLKIDEKPPFCQNCKNILYENSLYNLSKAKTIVKSDFVKFCYEL
jgi:RNase P subunit RPR2